jgi:hypothetical protein
LAYAQDGEAHLARGFSSFGAYAEYTFDGLSAANAKKISVQGAVLLGGSSRRFV